MNHHTPGPWDQETLGAQLRAVKISGQKARRIMVLGGPAIAYLPQGREDIQEANAKLIAAAPDMLEALKQTTDQIEADNDSSGLDGRGALVRKARAAITKAEGSK